MDSRRFAPIRSFLFSIPTHLTHMNDPLYLFGLVPMAIATVPAGTGVAGTHPLERLDLGELTAIVSTVPQREFVGPEAEERLRDLAWVGPRALRHQAVIRDLMDQGPVVPVRFATLFSDAGNLRAHIVCHQATLLAFLERTRDHQAEWSVKALYDRKSALARITERTLAERETELTALALGRRYFKEQKLRKAVESELGTTLAEACRWLHERLRMEQLDPASLTGAFEAEVRSRLGSPPVADEFVLDGNLREFRIELFNHFTPEEVAAASIPIRELTWTRGDRQAMTLWLERSDDTWKVAHGLIWYQDADF